MSKRKVDSKSFAQAKRRRRRALTFMRMLRYGVNNFSRNSWLTIAATAVMTITLLIIFSTFTARNVLTGTIDSFRDKVDMSIYLKSGTSEKDVKKIEDEVSKLSSVRSVSSISPEQARQNYIDANKNDPKALDALNQSNPDFSWTVRAKVNDINNTSELQKYTETSELYKKHQGLEEPSFAGPYRNAIETVGGAVNFADKAGLIAGIVFTTISSLIIFNTIRMAIFNRREEIQMMKLIGAERSFIRGPFIVEAVVYGFIAAILATGIGIAGLFFAKDSLTRNGIIIEPILNMLVLYSPFVLMAMIAIGAVIGIVSSLMATQRYLKI